MNEDPFRAELEALPPDELYRRARRRALTHLDVGFFWSLLRTIPAAEAGTGDVGEAEADVSSSIIRLADLRRAGEGELGEALKPTYVDYLARHPPRERR